MRANLRTIALALGAAALPVLGGAQQPNASPAAAALSGAYTAVARGYDAVAWNPANLGMPGNPAFSLGTLSFSGGMGLKPISWSDYAPYSGDSLPKPIRESWLQTITANGGETGNLNAGATGLAVSLGPFAFQVGGSLIGTTNLSPDVVEAMLFGNVARTDTIRSLSFAGSRLNVGGFTTGAVSYGLALPSAPLTHMSIGVTGKYILGNFLAQGRDNGSSFGKDSLTAQFPVIMSLALPAAGDTSSLGSPNLFAGKGFGVDVGFAWSNPVFTIGAALQNAVNTFAWDTTKLTTRVFTAKFKGDSITHKTLNQAFGAAPQDIQDSVTLAKFKPAANIGAAIALDSKTTFSADLHQQIGDGITSEPKTVAAGGLEWRGIPFLSLRGGGAYLTGGWGASGGFGLHFGPYELGAAFGVRSQNGEKRGGLALSLLALH